MAILDLFFPFTELETTANASSAYLYQMIYVAKATDNTVPDKYIILTKELLDAGVSGLHADEVPRLQKAFSRGMTQVYLAITFDATNYNYTNWDTKGTTEVAFTTVLSPDHAKPATISANIGILVMHETSVITVLTQANTVRIYDPENEAKGLGIFAQTLITGQSSRFLNLQYKAFNEYTAVVSESIASQLRAIKQMFVFTTQGTSDVLLYSTGVKAPADAYIKELWKFNVKNSMKDFVQLNNPYYYDENIELIEGVVDNVSKDMFGIYGLRYTSAKAPTKEEQLASDVDMFKVNNVFVQLSLPSQILDVGTIVEVN